MQCHDKQHETACDRLMGELLIQLLNAENLPDACDAAGIHGEARTAIRALVVAHKHAIFCEEQLEAAENRVQNREATALRSLQGFDAAAALTRLQSIAANGVLSRSGDAVKASHRTNLAEVMERQRLKDAQQRSREEELLIAMARQSPKRVSFQQQDNNTGGRDDD